MICIMENTLFSGLHILPSRPTSPSPQKLDITYTYIQISCTLYTLLWHSARLFPRSSRKPCTCEQERCWGLLLSIYSVAQYYFIIQYIVLPKSGFTKGIIGLIAAGGVNFRMPNPEPNCLPFSAHNTSAVAYCYTLHLTPYTRLLCIIMIIIITIYAPIKQG